MVSRKVKVINPSGLHLSPAGRLCQEALKYRSSVWLSFDGTKANAKSVLSVLDACVKCSDEIEIICDGEDEEQALAALIVEIEEGLGEC
ncbi:MAG: HPr family phosphocarrier protein [Blautia sp.]|nr:HPr family phosphocarrier protein [Blautia sp.]